MLQASMTGAQRQGSRPPVVRHETTIVVISQAFFPEPSRARTVVNAERGDASEAEMALALRTAAFIVIVSAGSAVLAIPYLSLQ